VGSKIERHADGAAGELLRREHRRVRRHDQGRVGDDSAAAELAAAGARVLHPAVVAPFAGVIHVRLALLEQLAMTGEGVDPFRAGHVGLDYFLDPLLAVGPLDQDPFFLE